MYVFVTTTSNTYRDGESCYCRPKTAPVLFCRGLHDRPQENDIKDIQRWLQ